jgi:Ca2+-binding RTX toxin-like protein
LGSWGANSYLYSATPLLDGGNSNDWLHGGSEADKMLGGIGKGMSQIKFPDLRN